MVNKDKEDKFLDYMEEYVLDGITSRIEGYKLNEKEEMLVRLATGQTTQFYLTRGLLHGDELNREADKIERGA